MGTRKLFDGRLSRIQFLKGFFALLFIAILLGMIISITISFLPSSQNNPTGIIKLNISSTDANSHVVYQTPPATLPANFDFNNPPTYDYIGAIKAGANPVDVMNYMASQTGYNAEGAITAGANQNDVLAYMATLPFKNKTVMNNSTSVLFGISGLIIFLLYYAFLICISLSLFIRRWHDLGESGWYVILNYIPLINIFVLLYLFFGKGQDTDNRFGSSPKQFLTFKQILFNLN